MPSSSPSKKEDEEPTIPETMTEFSDEEINFGRKTQQRLANDRSKFCKPGEIFQKLEERA